MARLQRFYGGDPERWLHLPSALVRCYARAVPRLDAGEMLQRVTASALGMGNVPKDEASRILGSLRDDAAVAPKRSNPLTPEEAEMLGFRIVRH